MKVLNGWKEIAECLHRTPWSARRWERLGLPVRRISNGPRSPIIAFSEEIEDWVRRRNNKRMSELDAIKINRIAFLQARRQTRRLVNELRAAGIEHQRLLRTILNQIGKASD